MRAVWAAPLGDEAALFVNSADTAFVDFLTKFADAWRQRAYLSDDEADAQTGRLRQELQRLDSDALNDPNTWWAAILEQMHDGLL
jgi:SUKH-4 immunity protein